MELWVVIIIAFAGMSIIFFLTRLLLKQPYSKRTTELFLDIKKLEQIGFTFTGDKYQGTYKGFPIYIYVATNIQENDHASVMIATETSSGPIDFLKTFKTGYFKDTDSGGCTFVGFLLYMKYSADPVKDIQLKLDQLIILLNEKSIKPFPIG